MYAGVVHKQELNVVCTANTEEEARVVVARMASSAPAGVTIMQVCSTFNKIIILTLYCMHEFLFFSSTLHTNLYHDFNEENPIY